MTRVIHGIVHGKTVSLQEDPGLAEGQPEELTIRTIGPATRESSGEGLLRTEGALADDPYWDAIMTEVHAERRNDTRREPAE